MSEELQLTPEQAKLEAEEKSKQEQQNIHNRLVNWYKIDEVTWSSAEEVAPGSGIWVYHDVLPKDMNIIERLPKVNSMAAESRILSNICFSKGPLSVR